MWPAQRQCVQCHRVVVAVGVPPVVVAVDVVVVVRGGSNVANDQSIIELTNGQWRQTTKTYLYSTEQPKNAWYGFFPRAQGGWGLNMRQCNSLMNSRKQASLGNQSATDVWNASWRIRNGNADEAEAGLKELSSMVDRAWKIGIFHRKKAANLKRKTVKAIQAAQA